jgi:crotonyl-CoA carboxylase/reductase
MLAQVIRPDRYGDVLTAFVVEEVDVPAPGEHEVLIAVMAAGINYNNVWAARGIPVDIVKEHEKTHGDISGFHIGGSDCSGIVFAKGGSVTNVEVGDSVVTHPGWWDPTDQWVQAGRDPMLAPTAGIWGYNTNHGAFAQFCIAQDHQVLPKPPSLSWEEAAASTLVGTTAYRMLFGWSGNTLQQDHFVLVWGGSGGLGGQAIQLVAASGARCVAVVSDDERGEYAESLGASGYVRRDQFNHWGIPPHWTDEPLQRDWVTECRRFGKAIWEALGEKRSPDIVLEHPGEATIATSGFLCAPGGMVVICAGTTGYSATVDLRHHWVRQKRLQGSHGTNDEQARAYNRLLLDGLIDPCLGRVYEFDEIPQAHYDMQHGIDVLGNRVALVGAAEPGLGRE